MKVRLLVISVFIASVVSGQVNPPSNELVKNVVINSGSPYYYPNLFPRYISGDTTLTNTDYYYLYYGYTFQESYKPLESIPAEDLVLLALSGDPQREDFEKVIEYGNRVMDYDPFSPRNINFLTYAYGQLGDTINEKVNADRFNKIISAIESSGTGLKDSSPWHVLWFSHARDILNVKGVELDKEFIISKDVEYIRLKERDKDGNKGYYFDYSRMYLKKPQGFDDKKRVEGIELKGLKSNKKR